MLEVLKEYCLIFVIFLKVCYNFFMKNIFKSKVIGFFTAILLLLFFVEPTLATTLKFAHISDIHYANIQEENNYKLLARTSEITQNAVKQINEEKNIDFVMITGDGVNYPQQSDFEDLTKIINKLHSNWYFAIGNHDINPNGEFSKSELIKFLNKNNKNFKFNSTYYTFKPKKRYRVIVLDGVNNEEISSKGIISQEQLCWLDDLLSKSKKDTILIFLHFPLYPPNDYPSHEISNSKEFKSVLKKYKMPIAIFSGHYHFTKIIKRGNIINISTPSLLRYPNAFRIIEVNSQKNATVFKIKFTETDLKELKKKTKILTFGNPNFYGREQDRNVTIIIKNK